MSSAVTLFRASTSASTSHRVGHTSTTSEKQFKEVLMREFGDRDHPLERYLERGRRISKEPTAGERLFGVPKSQQFSLRRLRLEATSDQKIKDIVNILMEASVLRCVDHDDWSDVSTLLRDTNVQWSFFDIFEVEDADGKHHVIRTWSYVGRLMTSIPVAIACYSVWYSSVVLGYADVLRHDELVGPGTPIYWALESADLLLDAVYFIATLIRLRTSLIDPVTYVETCSPEGIRQKLFRSFSFWADLASCLPFTLVHAIAAPIAAGTRYLKLTRFHQLLPWVRHWQGGTTLIISPIWQSVGRLVLFIIVCGHLLGCAWVRISSPDKHEALHACVGSTEPVDLATVARPFFLYYAYFSKKGLYLTLGIIVDGQSELEDFLIVTLAPLGAVMNAFIFSAIVVLVSRSYAVVTKHIEKSNQLKQAISAQALPASLQLRIFAYHTQMQVQRHSGKTSSLFRGISSQMRFELHLVLYFNLVMEADIFKRSHPRVLRQIVLAFEDKLFLPGDYVCKFGDEGTAMYFIFKGVCTVFDENREQIAVMQKGEHFGEVSLLTGHRRTAYVRSDFFATLASLFKSHFDRIMKEFPRQKAIIIEAMLKKQQQWMDQPRVTPKGWLPGAMMTKEEEQEPASLPRRTRGNHVPAANRNNGLTEEAVTTGCACRESGDELRLHSPDSSADGVLSDKTLNADPAGISEVPLGLKARGHPEKPSCFGRRLSVPNADPETESDGMTRSKSDTVMFSSTVRGVAGAPRKLSTASILSGGSRRSRQSAGSFRSQNKSSACPTEADDSDNDSSESSVSNDEFGTDVSYLVDTVSKRCFLAAESISGIVERMQGISKRHRRCINMLSGLEVDPTLLEQRERVEYYSSELDCMCSDVDALAKMAEDWTRFHKGNVGDDADNEPWDWDESGSEGEAPAELSTLNMRRKTAVL